MTVDTRPLGEVSLRPTDNERKDTTARWQRRAVRSVSTVFASHEPATMPWARIELLPCL